MDNTNTETGFGPAVPFGHPDWRHPGTAGLGENKFVSVNHSPGTETPTMSLPQRGRRRSNSFSNETPFDLNAVKEALVKLEQQAMSNPNMFPAFLDSSPTSNNLAGLPRQSPSPIAQHQVNQQVNGAGMNGMNGMNVSLPMNAGHQMDLNLLFNQVEELSQLLKENREKTQAIIASAEELAVG